jgi:outer membrane lipopolysaccharide assembly protein LptE/RlpB
LIVFPVKIQQVRLLRWGALTAALLVLAGCGHESKLYSAQDAKRAFAREGFVLVPTGIEHRILLPKSAEPFTVVVARTEADAKNAYRAMNRESARLTFDLRARNVLTSSDTGLSPGDKARLRRAMRHLR